MRTMRWFTCSGKKAPQLLHRGRTTPFIFLLTLLSLSPGAALAEAEAEALIPPDRNFDVKVADILPNDDGGRVLYWTRPTLEQAHVRDGKGNIYLLGLKSSPWTVENRLVLADYPREPGMTLCFDPTSDDIRVIVNRRIDQLSPDGKKISSQDLAVLDRPGLRVTDAFARKVACLDDGSIVIVAHRNTRSGQLQPELIRIEPGGDIIRRSLEVMPGVDTQLFGLWPAGAGTTLAMINVRDNSGTHSFDTRMRYPGVKVIGQSLIVKITADGRLAWRQVLSDELWLLSLLRPEKAKTKPGQSVMEQIAEAQERDKNIKYSETLSLYMLVRHDTRGELFVLFERSTDNKGRNGYFLWRLAPDGELRSTVSLSSLSSLLRIRSIVDFAPRADGGMIIVADVSNPQTGKRQWVVAEIDPKGKLIEARALPVETRNPSRIAMVAGKVVVAGTAARSGRLAVYALDTGRLDKYTAAADSAAKKQARARERRNQAAAGTAMERAQSESLARALGVDADKLDTMSKEERNSALANMDFGKIGQLMQEQMAIATQGQQAALSAGAGGGRETTTPDDGTEAIKSGPFQYKDPQQRPLTLIVSDTRNARELFSRDYADGRIDEYFEFSQFDAPADALSIEIRDGAGEVVKRYRVTVSLF